MFFFFFKQKTAYEMRISDWSSDVCSSDLRGHRGANHPVKNLATGKVEITSQNHGFMVDTATLPKGVVESHVSLFDGTNEGIAVEGRPVFSVQYHPEASPGPRDSHYLFERFVAMIEDHKARALQARKSTRLNSRP